MYFIIINENIKIAMNMADHREHGDELVYYNLSESDAQYFRELKNKGYSDKRVFAKLSPGYEIRVGESEFRRSGRLSRIAKKFFRR